MTEPITSALPRSYGAVIAAIPGIVDTHIQQEVYAPDLYVQIDRARALQFGITPSDIANNIGTSLSSSKQVYPNFWTDPKEGIPHYIAVQTPQYLVSSMGWVTSATPRSASGLPRRQRSRSPANCKMSRPLPVIRCRGAPTRPTFSRSTRSMPAPKAAISAASPAIST